MKSKRDYEFTFSEGYVWLPNFYFDRETYKLLLEASKKSGRTAVCEGILRLKDHLQRFSMVSTEGVTTQSKQNSKESTE